MMKRLCWIALLAWVVSCSSTDQGETEDTQGFVRATLSTTGELLPDSFPVTILSTDSSTRFIDSDSARTYGPFPAETAVRFSLVYPSNCASPSGPGYIDVVPSATDTVAMMLEAACRDAFIWVTVNESGAFFPDSWQVTVAGAPYQYLPRDSTRLFGPLMPDMEIPVNIFYRANCAPTSGMYGSTYVTPVHEDTITATLDVQCHVQYGNLKVTVTTTGTNLPPSYPITLNGTDTLTVTPNGTKSVSITLGTYLVGLHLPANCAAASTHPVSVTLSPSDVPQELPVNFTVTCGAPGAGQGFVRATLTTTGTGAPDSFAVTVQGPTTVTRYLPPNGARTYGPFPPDSMVHLDLVYPAHCTAGTGSGSATVTPGVNDTAPVALTAECVDEPGSVKVTVQTTGTDIPATFPVMRGGVDTAMVGANDSTVIPLGLGTHVLDLRTPANCTVTSSHPVIVQRLPGGSEQSAMFQVLCQPPGPAEGHLRVVIHPTGTNFPNPWTVRIAGETRALPAGDTMGVFGPYATAPEIPVQPIYGPFCAPTNGSYAYPYVTPLANDTLTVTFDIKCGTTSGSARPSERPTPSAPQPSRPPSLRPSRRR